MDFARVGQYLREGANALDSALVTLEQIGASVADRLKEAADLADAYSGGGEATTWGEATDNVKDAPVQSEDFQYKYNYVLTHLEKHNLTDTAETIRKNYDAHGEGAIRAVVDFMYTTLRKTEEYITKKERDDRYDGLS